MSKYVSEEVLKNSKYIEGEQVPDELIYELKSIVIHRGGAYGGHYFAYIKDDLNEGNWHLDEVKEDAIVDKPTQKIIPKYDPTQLMTDK